MQTLVLPISDSEIKYMHNAGLIDSNKIVLEASLTDTAIRIGNTVNAYANYSINNFIPAVSKGNRTERINAIVKYLDLGNRLVSTKLTNDISVSAIQMHSTLLGWLEPLRNSCADNAAFDALIYKVYPMYVYHTNSYLFIERVHYILTYSYAPTVRKELVHKILTTNPDALIQTAFLKSLGYVHYTLDDILDPIHNYLKLIGVEVV